MAYGKTTSPASKRVAKADKAVAKAKANPTKRNQRKAKKAVTKKKRNPKSPTYRNTF